MYALPTHAFTHTHLTCTLYLASHAGVHVSLCLVVSWLLVVCMFVCVFVDLCVSVHGTFGVPIATHLAHLCLFPLSHAHSLHTLHSVHLHATVACTSAGVCLFLLLVSCSVLVLAVVFLCCVLCALCLPHLHPLHTHTHLTLLAGWFGLGAVLSWG